MMKEKYNSLHRNRQIKMELGFLIKMIEFYCSNKHPDKIRSYIQAKGRAGEFLKDVSIRLCPDCKKLVLHAIGKRIVCPHDPKPMCKACPTHCYGKGYRERITEVMRTSGALFA
ncbi:MAG: nitrous oxide-stimulated promoter family protein [Thermodesulfobacteriota bacterium]